MRAVLDANVVAAGVGWQGEGWLCLVKMARRHFSTYATDDIVRETWEMVLRLLRQKQWKDNAPGWLIKYLENVHLPTCKRLVQIRQA